MNYTIYIIIGVGVALLLYLISVYNGFIQLKNKVDEGWADIDTQLKRRYDLIPNLVETVKGYAKHENKTFEYVTKARTAAMNAGTPAEKAQAENMLSATLKSLFAVAESYPELKANQNFMDLQGTLTDTEDKLQLARRYYNATVRDFNTKLETFPDNVVGGIMQFKKRNYFEINNPAEKENVKVSFSDDKK